MLAMLSSRRSSFSLQLLRHFSIRVPSLKKQSLVAQLLRGNCSPKLTKSTQTRNGAKATHFLQQGEASLRSVYQHPPFGLSVELPGLENGRQQDNHLVEDVACSDDIAKLSVRSKKESKEVQQHSDGATKLSLLSLREGSKAHHCKGETELPVLSVPSTRKGSKAHHSIGDIQPSVRAQTSSKRGEANYGDGKPFQTERRKAERRKVDPAKVSVQPQIAREEGRHSHGPVVSKPGGKRLALQTRGASQKPGLPVSKLGISPLRTGSSKEISSLASQVGDEPGKCITGKDVQNTVKHTLFVVRSAVGSETSKQSKVKNYVEVYFVNINQRITDSFLSDLQRKIELVSIESAPLTHVKALLMKKAFLSASPEKLAEVLTVLKLFFGSGDKACEILTGNTGIIRQPLERLQQRLKVLVEFEVDKATCYRIGTTPCVMTIKVEKYRSVLSFLKDLGLSAESRNSMLYKFPYLMKFSVTNRMQPIVNFFESIEIAGPTLLKLLESRPATLGASLDKNLRVMHKICQHVGLSVMEFVEALKKLSTYNNNDYFLPYKFFREQGLSDEAVASMIKRNPDFLTLSVETLEAKLHFLLHTAKRDISEIVTHPAYLKYSLASRIIPRFKILEALNLPRQPCLATVLLSTRYSPNCI